MIENIKNIDYQNKLIEKLKIELKNVLIALKVKNNIPLWKAEDEAKKYIEKIIETL